MDVAELEAFYTANYRKLCNFATSRWYRSQAEDAVQDGVLRVLEGNEQNLYKAIDKAINCSRTRHHRRRRILNRYSGTDIIYKSNPDAPESTTPPQRDWVALLAEHDTIERTQRLERTRSGVHVNRKKLQEFYSRNFPGILRRSAHQILSRKRKLLGL